MLVAWLAEPEVESLYCMLAFLAIGVALIWISRRMNASRVVKKGLNFKYGLTYLGCTWSGVNLLDAIALYLFIILVTFLVALVEGKLGVFHELFGAMYFIITAAVCVTYPIFYHPYASTLEEIAGILKAIDSKLGVSSYSYARGVGLMMRLKDGTIAIISAPPFTSAPFIPLAFLDELLLKKDEERLQAPVILIKTEEEKSHFSLSSFLEWPLSPRLRRTASVETKELSLGGKAIICFKAQGEVDIPHPERKVFRLKASAKAVYAQLSGKVLERLEKDTRYFARLIPQLISTLLESCS